MGACLPSPFSVPLSLALTLRSYQSSHPGGIPGGWGKEISLLIAQRGLGDRETSRTGGWGQRGPRNTGQVVMLPKALGWPRSLFGLFRTPQWTNPKGFFFCQSNNCCSKVGVHCFNSLLSKCKCTHPWKFHLCPLICSVFHRVDAGPPS